MVTAENHSAVNVFCRLCEIIVLETAIIEFYHSPLV